jgi:hypothetical protein
MEMDILGIHDKSGSFHLFVEQSDRAALFQVNPESDPPFDYATVSQMLVNNPALANFDPEEFNKRNINIDALKAELCNALDVTVSPDVLLQGFSYDGVRIQGDPVAQQNLTAFLTAVNSGVPVPYPIEWRTKANDIYLIQDLAGLQVFSGKMLKFVQTVFHVRWNLKDAIRAATTVQQAQALYDAGVAQMYLIGDNV